MGRLRTLAGTAASVPITLFGLVLVTFLIGRVMPIDPTLAIVGDHAPPDVVAHVRHQLGLDRPLPVQFGIYLLKLCHGDLGRSVMTGNPVTADIAHFFPATSNSRPSPSSPPSLVGVPLGVLAAVKQRTRVDHAIRVFCLAGPFRAGLPARADLRCWSSTRSSARARAPAGPMWRSRAWCRR